MHGEVILVRYVYLLHVIAYLEQWVQPDAECAAHGHWRPANAHMLHKDTRTHMAARISFCSVYYYCQVLPFLC